MPSPTPAEPATLPPTTVETRKRLPLPDLILQEARRRRRRRVLSWGILLLVPALAAVVWILTRPTPVPMAARFRFATVTEGDVHREVRATGHVEAVTTVPVGAEISGRIATVEVDYNARVVRGQVLARFDRAALSAQLAQARATLAASKAERAQTETEQARSAREGARFEHLYATNALSENDRDNARATLQVAGERVAAAVAQQAAAQAALAIAQTTLEHAVVRAPIDGVVITRNVDPGQTVASALATPVLFSVAADLRKMRVIAAVDEADIGEIAVEQIAFFSVNAFPERVFQGLVTEVRSSPVILQDIVTYGTVVEVDNADLALKPGMTASVRVRTAAAEGVLRVSSAALRFAPPGEARATGTSAWILVGDTVERVEIVAGLSDGETTALAPGALHVGQSVIADLTPAGRKAYGLAH